ncbi:MAG TPA: long-chain fatty acid--CoA ligase [Candidatus Limnocylindria bacterium]|nr:long-chain fatty acid--CoA ligase [Candidatus Limnocylindria bacterium]
MTVHRGEPLTVSAGDLPASVVALVHRSVERNPDGEAIRWKAPGGWSSWTYRQLWDQVAATSIGLRGLGMGAGDRVVILSRSRPEWLVTDLACQALGAVTCPLYPGDPPARLASLTRAVGARWLLVEDARLLSRLRSGMDDEPLPGRVILFDAHDFDAHDGGGSGLADLSVAPSAAALTDWERTWRALHPAQVSTIVHTIGTDGVPLGVVVAHGNLVHSFHAIVQAIPITSADTVLSVLPMSHMFERGAGILAPIGVGATVAFAERQIERWAADMAEVRPTLMATIPLFFERLEQRILADVARGSGYRRLLFQWATGLGRRHYANHLAGRTDGPWLRLRRWVAARTVLAPVRGALGGRLRYLLSGGAALPESTGVFYESIGIPILEGYGLTETAPILTANRPESYRYGTVGQPVAGTEIRLDPTSGEIQGRGPQVMLGYLDRPADTARAVDAEGWLHTGDVGKFDEAGRLQITGRLKNLLVLATGKNVAPAPIEDAVITSPFIRQAVLLGDGRDATGILVVPDPEALEGRSEVAGLLRQEVERLTAEFASYERPRRAVVLPRPLTAELGELDDAGRPIRVTVIEHFPGEVAELFERSTRSGRRSETKDANLREASTDHQPEPTASATG